MKTISKETENILPGRAESVPLHGNKSVPLPGNN